MNNLEQAKYTFKIFTNFSFSSFLKSNIPFLKKYDSNLYDICYLLYKSGYTKELAILLQCLEQENKSDNEILDDFARNFASTFNKLAETRKLSQAIVRQIKIHFNRYCDAHTIKVRINKIKVGEQVYYRALYSNTKAQFKDTHPPQIARRKQLREYKYDKFYSFSKLALFFSIVVGLGESIMNVYFMGTYTFGALLSIALPSFIVNVFLFNADTFDFFKKFILNWREIFKFNDYKIIITTVGFVLAIFSGALTAFLELNSMLATFGTLFWGLSVPVALSAPPLGLTITVGILVAAAFFANSALMFAQVHHFFNCREYNIYGKEFKICFKYFTDIFSKHLTIKERGLAAIKFICQSMGIILGLLSAVAIYLVSLGLFKKQAFITYTHFCQYPIDFARKLTFVTVDLLGQPLNGIFYIRNIIQPLLDIKFHLIEKFSDNKLYRTKSGRFIAPDDPDAVNNIKKIEGNRTKLLMGFLFACSIINGVGQEEGVQNEIVCINLLRFYFNGLINLLNLNITNRQFGYIAGGLFFMSSTYANAGASTIAVKPYPIQEIIDESEIMQQEKDFIIYKAQETTTCKELEFRVY